MIQLTFQDDSSVHANQSVLTDSMIFLVCLIILIAIVGIIIRNKRNTDKHSAFGGKDISVDQTRNSNTATDVDESRNDKMVDDIVYMKDFDAVVVNDYVVR